MLKRYFSNLYLCKSYQDQQITRRITWGGGHQRQKQHVDVSVSLVNQAKWRHYSRPALYVTSTRAKPVQQHGIDRRR
jgi:hypothetical protein